MTPLLLIPLALLVGFAGGWWWARRASPPSDSAAPAASAPPAPPAPPSALPAPSPVAAVPPGSASPMHASLELHLVLNVMNRVVMGLQHDEQLQDGVSLLADYLRAVHEMQRNPSQHTFVQQATCYWQMSRWVHGQPSDSLHMDLQLPGMSPALLAKCGAELVRLIRQLESCSRAEAAVRITLPRPGDGTAGGACVLFQVVGVPAAAQAQLLASGASWVMSSSGLQMQSIVHA